MHVRRATAVAEYSPILHVRRICKPRPADIGCSCSTTSSGSVPTPLPALVFLLYRFPPPTDSRDNNNGGNTSSLRRMQGKASPTPSTTRQTTPFSPSDQQVYRNNETGVTRNIMQNIDLLGSARRSIGSFFLKLRRLCFAMLENKTRSERKEGKVSRLRVSRG